MHVSLLGTDPSGPGLEEEKEVKLLPTDKCEPLGNGVRWVREMGASSSTWQVDD